MITIVSLIYATGFIFLSSHMIYFSFTAPEHSEAISLSVQRDENSDNQDNQIYNNLADSGNGEDSNSSGCSSDTDDSEPAQQNNISHEEISHPEWLHETIEVSTFESDCIPPPSPPNESVTLHPKTVRFDPISRQHLTFPRSDYDRRVDPFIRTRMVKIPADDWTEIVNNLIDFKTNEMDAYNNPFRLYVTTDDSATNFTHEMEIEEPLEVQQNQIE